MSRILLHCTHLSKSFGPLCLFEGIALSIHAGERFALIGENGCGKTTLMHILARLQIPDEGCVHARDSITVAFLPQESIDEIPGITVRDYLLDSPLRALEKRMASLEGRLDEVAALQAWADLHEQYESLGGYCQIPLEKVLNPLQLDLALDLPMDQLSGGLRRRVDLAKTLLANADLILLDEPTNHLDEEMITWLKNQLNEQKGAAIIISHDRQFLNTSCNRLIELQHGRLTSYGGSYEFYLGERERLLQRQIEEFEREQEELGRLKEKIRSLTFSPRPHRGPSDSNKLGYNHRGSGQQKSVQRALENCKTKLAQLEEAPCRHPRPKTISGLAFATSPLQSEVAIEFDHVSKSYGSKAVFKDFTAQLLRGQRITICGPNGCGKSTLLACASGKLAVDGGQLRLCSSARVGYLDQDVALLPMQQSPEEYFADRFRLSRSDICSELSKAGLEGHELIQRPFNTLSTGQRKRLMLLSLLLEQPNVLLLDEPTNHLDFHTLEALEMALLAFDGALIAVSHDRTFIEKIATEVWRLS